MLNDALAALRLQDWYALAALLLTFAIQLHRKVPAFGSKLWVLIPDGWRWLPPVAYGAAIGFLAAFDDGKTLVDALKAAGGGALTIGLGSMGFAATLKETKIPWDGGAGGKLTPGSGASGLNLGAMLCALLLTGCSSSSPSKADAATAVQFAFDACDFSARLPAELQTDENKKACEFMRQARTVCTDVIAPAAREDAGAAPEPQPGEDDKRELPADADAGSN